LHRFRKECPDKTVWCFTGFTLDEELWKEGSYPRCDVTDEMLSLVDVLVDGRYVKALKDISLRFRGSSNQRIIDLPKTLEKKEIVLWND
jgi:anaerobic ribonucleoside-triphosphate reductase activating protein